MIFIRITASLDVDLSYGKMKIPGLNGPGELRMDNVRNGEVEH